MSWAGDGSWDRKVLLPYLGPTRLALQVKESAARFVAGRSLELDSRPLSLNSMANEPVIRYDVPLLCVGAHSLKRRVTPGSRKDGSG